jgi:HK97 family phage major capsid protein
MPVFNSLIARSETLPFIPEDAANEVFGSAAEQSAFLSLARQLRAMRTSEMKLKVLTALPSVYFVGEKGRSPQTFSELKQTTEAAWDNKYLYAEELAVIVPIPNNVLADTEGDIWAEIKPEIEGALAAKIDAATFFGVPNSDVPALWRDGIFTGMPGDHKVPLGEVGDLYDDIMGEGGIISYVEEDGFFVNGHVAAISMRSKLRGLRDSGTGLPLFKADMQGSTRYSLDGEPMYFPRTNPWGSSGVLEICGDWNQAVYSIRQDVNFELFNTGVIQDGNGAITHNLMQEDLSALRMTFRMGWELPNPINRVNATEATRYPFAALTNVGVS